MFAFMKLGLLYFVNTNMKCFAEFHVKVKKANIGPINYAYHLI